MQLTGTIVSTGTTENVSDKFSKRQLLLKIDETSVYPQVIPVEFVQAKTTLPDVYRDGQQVTIHINLRGSEYNGRHYCSIQGWKIEAVGGQAATGTPAPVNNTPDPTGLPF